MTNVTVSSANKRRLLYRNLTIAAIAALCVLTAVSRLTDANVNLAASIVAALCMVLALLQFNSLDEVAKQAHYIAWYWGGLVALMAIGVIAIGLSADLIAYTPIKAWLESWAYASTEEMSFVLGLLSGPILMLLGFAGWWAAFWLRRR